MLYIPCCFTAVLARVCYEKIKLGGCRLRRYGRLAQYGVEQVVWNGYTVNEARFPLGKKADELTDGVRIFTPNWDVIETFMKNVSSLGVTGLKIDFFPPEDQVEAGVTEIKGAVSIDLVDENLTALYTLDGTDPAVSETAVIYTAPITLTDTCRMQVAVKDTEGNLVSELSYRFNNITAPIPSMCPEDHAHPQDEDWL